MRRERHVQLLLPSTNRHFGAPNGRCTLTQRPVVTPFLSSPPAYHTPSGHPYLPQPFIYQSRAIQLYTMTPNTLLYQILLVGALVISLFHQASTYECYVCKDQDNNSEKCVKTVRQCDIGENTCMTVVRWGSTPYWDPTGLKQFYVSKECASSRVCENMKLNTSRRCDRIWYNDWECVECCSGDRCNYYITLSGSSLQPLILSIVLALAVPFLA